LAFLLLALPVQAGELTPTAKTLLNDLKAQAVKIPSFKGFSAEQGKTLYFAKRKHSEKNEERSCATCHTDDPKKAGETPVGKPIEPLAPSVNKERFTDLDKIEKWFGRNCKWVLERECTSEEKGHFLTYIFSL
jgi:cytochrome c peroxidase